MRDMSTRQPGDTPYTDPALGVVPTLLHAPPPAAPHDDVQAAATPPPTSAVAGPVAAAGALAAPVPRGPSLAASALPSGPSVSVGTDVLGRVAHILRLEQIYSLSSNPYPYSGNVSKAHAIALLPQIAARVEDPALLERMAQTVLLLEHKDTHPLSRLLLLHRLSACPAPMREAIALFAPMLCRKLTSVMERCALFNMIEANVHSHDIEDFCRLTMLFADSPTAYVGATALGKAGTIDALLTLLATDTTTVQKTPALVNAANLAIIGPVLWPNLEQTLQILATIDGLTTMPSGLSAWFVRNRHCADEWERIAHRVAQTCFRLQFTPGRHRLSELQMAQRVSDFVEAFGGDASDPAEDPVPTYTPEP